MKRSDLARPPIQDHEIEGAHTSICVYHNGLVAQTGDVEGKVMFCPVGKMYWRYSKKQGGMYAPLRYPKAGIV
ncbi:MAG: hypothetical protein KGL39_31050 [Patescibacteria group bacterium]|nr:hypothetical protein [Patescibacteria group bacterium]